MEFRESIRYEYDLNHDSVVLDCGGYHGEFAAKIIEKYGCRVHVLEPVHEWWAECVTRLHGNELATIHKFGIGMFTGTKRFTLHGDMTGEFCNDGAKQNVIILSASSIFAMIGQCDLMKVNIEGGEFDVLVDMIRTRTISRCKNIQVQWHQVVPDAESRRNAIMARLGDTHELQWDFGWTWQSWRRK